ncbi:MAG: hypothetical protein L0387_16265 [Acidobacteria bacterium]|nr:hypothetical protein [Acidobacteriota bacterium]
MNLLRSLLLLLVLALQCEAAGIDVPLTVQETAGIDRHQWPVRAGVPLPKGAIKSVEKLQIMDAQGRFVPALFAVANRWWEDGSIQWVHCDFAATVAAHRQTAYVLREVLPLPEFPSAMGFIPRGKDFEVITGPLRLVLGGSSNQLIDQVWVDEGWGYNFNEQTKILDSGNFDMVLTSGGRAFRTSHWTQNRIEVEEHNALRAVVRITGSFALAQLKERRLDYLARLTVYGGKTYFKLDLTLLNRQNSEIPLDELSLSFKLNVDLTQQKFIFGGDPQDHTGNFETGSHASLSQDSADLYSLSGAVQGKGSGKSAKVGWVDLFDNEHGLSAVVRWFGQLHPKALEVRNDGTLVVKLLPSRQRAQALAPLTAKTHELMFHFHGKRQLSSGQVKNVMLGFQRPVYAVATPAWYCRDTQAFGRLLDASPGLLRPEFESLPAKLDGWLTASRDAVLAAREVPGESGNPEPGGYGVFRFTNPLLAMKPPAGGPENVEGAPARGDFAHALYLHFFRTGDLKSLELAEETLAWTADAGLIAEEPPEAGGQKAAASLSTQPSRVEPHGVEGLMDAYFFTGNRRFLNAGRFLAARIAKEGSAGGPDVAGLASRSTSLLKGYEATGDRRWFDGAKGLIEALYAWQDGDLEKLRKVSSGLAGRWNESFKDGLGKTAWECGVAWNVLQHYQRLSGDRTVLARLQRSAEWLYRNRAQWNAERKDFLGSPQVGIVLAPGLAAVSEETGNQEFLDQARDTFQKALQAPPPLSDPGLFGTVFTAGQYFPWFLSKEFQPGPKRDVSVLSKP